MQARSPPSFRVGGKEEGEGKKIPIAPPFFALLCRNKQFFLLTQTTTTHKRKTNKTYKNIRVLHLKKKKEQLTTSTCARSGLKKKSPFCRNNNKKSLALVLFCFSFSFAWTRQHPGAHTKRCACPRGLPARGVSGYHYCYYIYYILKTRRKKKKSLLPWRRACAWARVSLCRVWLVEQPQTWPRKDGRKNDHQKKKTQLDSSPCDLSLSPTSLPSAPSPSSPPHTGETKKISQGEEENCPDANAETFFFLVFPFSLCFPPSFPSTRRENGFFCLTLQMPFCT